MCLANINWFTSVHLLSPFLHCQCPAITCKWGQMWDLFTYSVIRLSNWAGGHGVYMLTVLIFEVVWCVSHPQFWLEIILYKLFVSIEEKPVRNSFHRPAYWTLRGCSGLGYIFDSRLPPQQLAELHRLCGSHPTVQRALFNMRCR